MLKIKDGVDFKKLEKFRNLSCFECDERTGKTRIKELKTMNYSIFNKLKFKKKETIFAKRIPINKYELAVNKDIYSNVDLDKLYDLIRADMVVKELIWKI